MSSVSKQRATELVTHYDCCLEQQIAGRGSSLVCRDEELWSVVEGLLRDGYAEEVHCLGLDPLKVMEESLKAAAAAAAASGAAGAKTTASANRLRASGGLRGLARAFEVLEQAAVNLYLRPWREEYKVVKMYSGMFTHYIKPVLSMPQIEKLFGLLGYEAGVSRHEQLHLRSPRLSAASADDHLRVSCAFFLARCECSLLLEALGKHAGDVQWELSVVRERQRGHDLQVSLANTMKALEVHQPQPPFDGESDMDLYTDDQVNGGHRATAVHVHVDDDESPRSLAWGIQKSSPTVKTHSNGMTSLSSSSLSTREPLCTSTLQLTKPAPLDSAGTRQATRALEDKAVSQTRSLQVEATRPRLGRADAVHHCCCVVSPDDIFRLCSDCNTLHNITCALLEFCYTGGHHVIFPDNLREELKHLRALESAQSASLRVSDTRAAPSFTNSITAMSSLALRDDHRPSSTNPPLHPIAYHDCCDLAEPDPQLLCHSCGVFHSSSCELLYLCLSDHDTVPMGVCSCGRKCSRKPLVLCRYCGKEYCRECWYRNPVNCTCGQTFDQSSAV